MVEYVDGNAGIGISNLGSGAGPAAFILHTNS